METVAPSIQKIPGNELVSRDERLKILEAMDKTDYKRDPEFIDLENMFRHVIQTKQVFPLWNLTDVQKIGKIDTYPP